MPSVASVELQSLDGGETAARHVMDERVVKAQASDNRAQVNQFSQPIECARNIARPASRQQYRVIRRERLTDNGNALQ
jgi:hypothetical protein